MKKLALKDMPRIERPREKLLRYGAKKLQIEELTSILLRHGTKKHSLSKMSSEVSNMLKTKVLNTEPISFEELKGINGLGNVQSIEILAVMELLNRFSNIKSSEPITPNFVFSDLFEVRNSRKESFYAYYLDSRLNLIKRELISVGTVDSSLVHPREVFEPAIKCSSVSIVVAHNHPSGNINPSDADIEITEVLKDCGDLLGIKLLDHIIVTKSKYYSFKENSLLL